MPATRLGACSPGTEKEPRRHKKGKEKFPGAQRKRKDDKREEAEGVNYASRQF